MRSSEKLKHFYKFINAVDMLDSIKNEVIIWVTDEDQFGVDFNIFGKPAKARLFVDAGDECAITLFDELNQYDGKLVINCDTAEEYTEVAVRMVSYLHNPRDQF